MKLIVNAVCDVGLVRQRNEDMVLVDELIFRNSTFGSAFNTLVINQPLLFAVADGMGGHNAGDIASELVLKRLYPVVKHLPDDLDNDALKNILESAVKDIHDSLNHESAIERSKAGMGATLIALLIYQEKIFYFSAGDSRLYRFRNGLLKQISRDHSVSEMFGKDRSDSHMIVNSIGGGEEVFIEFNDLTGTVLSGDKLILCSDGVSDMIDDETLEGILEKENAINIIVERAKQNGGEDNISIIIIDLEIEQEPGTLN